MNARFSVCLFSCIVFCSVSLAWSQVATPPGPEATGIPAPPSPGDGTLPVNAPVAPPALPPSTVSAAAPTQPAAEPPTPPPGSYTPSPPPGAVMVAPGQPYYVYPPGPYGPQPLVLVPAAPLPSYRWSAAIDALFLDRSAGGCTYLGSAHGNGPPDGLYSDDVFFPLTAGMRLELTRRSNNEEFAISGTYWGLQRWSVSDAVYGDPNHFSVLAFSPYLQMSDILTGIDDTLGYTDTSEVHNVELNGLFRLNASGYWQLDWLVGARYLYLADHFTLTGLDDWNSTTEQVDIHTTNNLMGVQTGLLFTQGWNRFRWDAGLKFGVFVNAYHQHGTDTATAPQEILAQFTPYDASNDGSAVAGLVEFTLNASFRLTDALWLRLGYEFCDVGGLALAPRQLGGFGHGGNVTLDGLSIGLQAMW
jgi:hypothetical protein